MCMSKSADVWKTGRRRAGAGEQMGIRSVRSPGSRAERPRRVLQRARACLLQSLVMLAAVIFTTAQGLCQTVPGTQQDRDFDTFAKTLNLETPSLEFHYKAGRKGGSSVGFHIATPGGRKSGSFVPYNTSSDPEAEVVSYRLARFLGFSDIYNPVTYYDLGPLASARFRALMRKHSESDPDRAINYNSIAAQFRAHPNTIFGIYRYRPKGKVYAVESLGSAGLFNPGSWIGPLIRANGRMPASTLVSLPGVKGQRPGYPKPVAEERDLAAELSNIMVIDQLMGQWDRFWKNLEATGDSNGRLHLMARDNGGATVNDWEWHGNYDGWLSRYDRNTAAKLRELNAFLKVKGRKFAGFDDIEKWKTAVGFRKPSSFSTFKRKLELLVDKKLPGLDKQYGAKAYFEDRPKVFPQTSAARVPSAAGTDD